MAEATATEIPEKTKSSKMPLIMGLVLALAGGGGGFFAVSADLIPFGESSPEEKVPEKNSSMISDVEFIPMDQLTISLPAHSSKNYLRFRAELEVPGDHAKEVTKNLPRVVDVLNTYLRALEMKDLEEPAALSRLRSQMLRRVQIVTGQDHVNDLLIMEFVLQ